MPKLIRYNYNTSSTSYCSHLEKAEKRILDAFAAYLSQLSPPENSFDNANIYFKQITHV